MCGIVGQFNPNRIQSKNIEAIRVELGALRHRGPDGHGLFYDNHTILGHVRLAIIDLDQGHQPMQTQDGQLVLTYNGEIYNYLELQEELKSLGIKFQTQSDTEVLLLGYREWGEKILEKMNGMYAFCIYDKAQQSLFCARDPYGQKPFYYTEKNGSLYFSSELRTFLNLKSIGASLNYTALKEYLKFESFYFDQTICEGVFKLPPGHSLFVKKGHIARKQFHTNVPMPPLPSQSDSQVSSSLKQAVRLCYRADVPVGVLLSGGLDSSLVLAILRSLYPDQKLSSFHIRVTDPTYDESVYAEAVAKLCRTQHHVYSLDLKNLAELAESVPSMLDEPQGDPGILPKYLVCKQISEHHKVALTGDGGDEFFYGYLTFKAQQIARFYRFVPDFIHERVVSPLANKLPSKSGYMKLDFLAKHFAKGFPAEDALRNHQWTRSFLSDDLKQIVRKQEESSQGIDYLRDLYGATQGAGYLGRLAFQYQKTYLPDYVLCNSDRASMLNSVELRSPFLDVNLTRLINSVPDKTKMPGLRTKQLLKKVAEDYLPKELIYRKKVGFTVPIADLLRNELRPTVEDLFSEKRLKNQGLFNHRPIRNMLDRHFSKEFNYYKPIWTLYCLQHWLQARNIC